MKSRTWRHTCCTWQERVCRENSDSRSHRQDRKSTSTGCLLLLFDTVFVCSGVFAEALCRGEHSQCLTELEEMPVSSLWPRNRTLRALASLLTAEDSRVNKAAADYLSSGASHSHFRARVSAHVCQKIWNNCDKCSQPCVNVLVCLGACRPWSVTPRRCRRLEVTTRGQPVLLSAVCRSVTLKLANNRTTGHTDIFLHDLLTAQVAFLLNSSEVGPNI